MWNHRVVFEPIDEVYGIKEVMYDEDGNIEGWTEDFTAPLGDTYEELQGDIKYYIEALKASILVEVDNTTLIPMDEYKKLKVIEDFNNKIVESQKPLHYDITKLIDDNITDLID